jgi:uncharacterized metal-binding protein
MFRRRWGVVMDEEYVQENILTCGMAASVGGVSGDFGMRLRSDRNNDRVSCKHAAGLELYTLDVTIADESRSLVPSYRRVTRV